MSFSTAYSLKNNEVTLTNCDREPVHIPGCIQDHGVLIALDADGVIHHVSSNCAAWLGQSPEQLLQKNWFALATGDWDRLLQQLDVLPRYIGSLDYFAGQRLEQPLDILAHQYQGMTILEGEAQADQTVRLEQAYAEVNRITRRLQDSDSLADFCQKLTTEIRHLTGLDRVMVYRFHEDLSGEVLAEAKRDDLHSYLTLRYPSEDIPKPARDIFRKIWVRPVPDIHSVTVEITPLLNPNTHQPLDMTYCGLRGASVMYTDYLKNMGVAAAFTLSLLVDGQLWGLVACHHYTPKQIAWPVRAACELLAQVASLQLRAAEQAEFAQYRDRLYQTSQHLITMLLETDQPLHALLTSVPNLMDFIASAGVAICENNVWYTMGQTPSNPDLNALADWLATVWPTLPAGTDILHTNALDSRFPAAQSYRAIASGLLAMPVSRNRQTMIMWFRPEVIQTVNWAGDPYSKLIVDGPGGQRLMPRSSFALWQEKVAGQALPWQPVEIDIARHLRLSLMEVLAARVESMSQQNHQLSVSNAELDAFAYVASHDLREPLRGIYHYAHHLKNHAERQQDAQSAEQTDHLLRLTKRMDNLIESLLHFSRVGRTTLEREPLQTADIVHEALQILKASRPHKTPHVTFASKLPTIQADRIRLREVWLNLLTNAVKYNDSPTSEITIGVTHTPHGEAFFVRDNGIGIAPAFHDHIFEMFKRLHGKDKYGGGSGAGLPIVKKIVERHGGTIWLESEPGHGTTFYFTLGEQA